jgi:hypothetical protein
VSPEKQLQLESYSQALAAQLARQRTSSSPSDDAVVRALREEYAVTEEEHAAVLDRLVRHDEGIAAHSARRPIGHRDGVPGAPAPRALTIAAARFLTFLLQPALRTHGGQPAAHRQASRVRLRDDPRGSGVASIPTRAGGAGRVGSRVSSRRRRAPDAAPLMVRRMPRASRADLLPPQAGAECPDPYVRAAALYLLESLDEATDDDYAALEADRARRGPRDRRPDAAVLAGEPIASSRPTIAKMIGLKSVDIFDALEPEDLAVLARAGRESWFAPNETLCREGEIGRRDVRAARRRGVVLRRDGDVDRLVAPWRAGQRHRRARGPRSRAAQCHGRGVVRRRPRAAAVLARRSARPHCQSGRVRGYHSHACSAALLGPGAQVTAHQNCTKEMTMSVKPCLCVCALPGGSPCRPPRSHRDRRSRRIHR